MAVKVIKRKASDRLRRTIFGAAAALFTLLAPAPYAFADGVDSTTSSASTSCSPVATPPAGLQSPTGADSVTYHYNSCTGLWENDYYTWSPITKLTTPKTPYVYTCDQTTWAWDYMQWVYSPARGSYRQEIFSVAQLPDGAVIAQGSLFPCAPPPPPAQNTANDSSGTSGGSGPSSSSTTSSTSNDNTVIGSKNSATIDNSLNSNALTGNASVTSNTLGGNATSGNATVSANVINNVQSSSSLVGAGVVLFTANINGDVQGNLVLDPSQLQPATQTGVLNGTNNVTVNAQNSGTITNNLTLNASTGNATVADNTQAGNATSGTASAVADVINTLDSMVSAGKSFVGVININGNLNGDVLMPQSFLDKLLATNAPTTSLTLSQDQVNDLNIAPTNNQSITNNIKSTAATGSATVDSNTAAGSATSGKASTKVTVFNLTGSQIVGSNALLVFVNVSGTWVGVIMNAPVGTTAAGFGSGITSDTINSANISPTNNSAITNNISANATSGDANVLDNTQAGNAASGNANTAVNLLNLNNSDLNLTGWFGVLFINVFGNWYGNFAALPPATPATAGGKGGGPEPASGQTQPAQGPFKFVQTPHAPIVTAVAATVSMPSVPTGHVLGASATANQVKAMDSVAKTSNRQFQIISGLLLAIGLGAIAVERLMSARTERQNGKLYGR